MLDRQGRIKMLEIQNKDLSLRTQCNLLELNRSGLYYKPVINDDSSLANMISDIYLKSDCRYGYRKITSALKAEYNIDANHKKILKMMNEMGIEGIYPRKFIKTTVKNKTQNNIYPYLLKNITINHPNQVWATDITYIKLPERFMYFTAIIDLYSRYIVAHELSGSLAVNFCIDTLNTALLKGNPIIFNTDQGSQFTSNEFIQILKNANIQISMDHKGRCFDNIFIERLWRTLKQESIYFYRPETITELDQCIDAFVDWYNNDRLHQALNYKTPKSIYYAINNIVH